MGPVVPFVASYRIIGGFAGWRPGERGCGVRGDRYGVSRSFRPRAALSCVVPRAAGAGPAAGCRPARRGVGRVYAGRYHAGRSSTRRRHDRVPDRAGLALGRFLPRQRHIDRHTVPSDYEVQFEGFPDRTDRIGLLTDSTRMSAVPGMRIYTHTAARLPPSSVLVFCKAGLPQPSTWYGCLYQPGTAGVGAAPTVWCLGCGTPTVGVAVGGRRHAPVPPSLLRGVHRPSINRIYRPTTRNDFKSSVYALCYRKSCWNASRATSAVRETDDSGM